MPTMYTKSRNSASHYRRALISVAVHVLLSTAAPPPCIFSHWVEIWLRFVCTTVVGMQRNLTGVVSFCNFAKFCVESSNTVYCISILQIASKVQNL
jgi:hypothetical protein